MRNVFTVTSSVHAGAPIITQSFVQGSAPYIQVCGSIPSTMLGRRNVKQELCGISHVPVTEI